MSSNQQTASTITLREFNEAIEAFIAAIEEGKVFTHEDYLQMGHLWNTILHYPNLMSGPTGKKFYELVRDEVIPKMVTALQMEVSRGLSFYSQRYDFRLGGPMDGRPRAP